MNIRFFVLLLSILNFSFGIATPSIMKDMDWQEVQAKARDAIVKIFVVSRDFNWFAPHCVNGTYTNSGTGFFINGNGEIATCSHVIENAIAVFVSIPSLGKHPLRANVISICPQHDIALLKLDDDSFAFASKELGQINYLEFDDSDKIQRGQEIISLGYPGTTIETEQIKGTIGVISARLNRLFQCDVAINPGNSGGPVLNKKGLVIGITTSQMLNAQNTNFVRPINMLKSLLPKLYEDKLVKINDLGIIWSPTTKEIRKYLNSQAEGCLIVDLVKSGKALLAGLQEGDIVCSVNGYNLDSYGEIKALYGDERMRFDEYIGKFPVGEDIVIDINRNGTPLRFVITIDDQNEDHIPLRYPAYETIEYEIFGGMIIMPLTQNYIQQKNCLKNRPGLQRYLTNLYDNEPRLVIVNLIPDSKLAHARTMNWGDTINEVNGKKVCTLADFRSALTKSIDTGVVVIKTTDELTLHTDNVLNVLSLYDSCKETIQLSHIHQYKLSETIVELIQKVDSSLLTI